ncbi:MAG: ankyrin repeat domain-containing protein [Woeseiaceae bacterium]|nr:ankyrin repeat domain-containing protein [Woeseiaceae bacterium]
MTGSGVRFLFAAACAIALAGTSAPAPAAGTDLLRAAEQMDNGRLEKLLQGGADPDGASDYGVTALHVACENRDDRAVRLLLDAGADPNAATWSGETVLMHCARTGATASVRALLEAGADPHAAERRKSQTALMWAAAHGHAGAVRVLLEGGADITARSSDGFTPLLFAARSGDVATARALVDAGADPDEATPEHGTTLVVAAAGGHEELALYLLEQGASADAADAGGITALHHAVAAGMAALNGVRYDPVYRVIPDNHHALAAALLEAGADPDRPIEKARRLGPDGSPFEMEGMTPFLLAAVSADVELLGLFRVHEANPNVVAKGGTTALIAAARAACTGACAFSAGGNRGDEAAVRRALEAVEAILAMGADIEAKNEDGQTALHMAAFTGSDPIVKLLAERGADVNVTDNYGQTPWSMASGISPVLRYRGLYGDHRTTVALLENLGATSTTREAMDPNAPPPPGQ